MRTRAVPAALAGLALLALSAWPALSASAIPPPLPVLVADGGFDSVIDGVPSAWQCEDGARIVRALPLPGTEFVSPVPLSDPSVPPVLRRLPNMSPRPHPSGGPTPSGFQALAADFIHTTPPVTPRATPSVSPKVTPPVTLPPAADFVHAAPAVQEEADAAFTPPPSPPKSPGVTPGPTPGVTPPVPPVGTPAPSPGGTPPPVGDPQPTGPEGRLSGTPGESTRAECAQTIPVRPSTRYTLSAKVRGGQAFLGSDYGVVWTPPSAGFTTLTTTFTTAAEARTVRVYLHGWYVGAPYEADSVVLSGPSSNLDVPAAPSGLTVQQQTSSTLRLRWSAVPGVTGYLVQRDGVTIAAPVGTSLTVPGLTPGAATNLTVLARNAAGQSAPSAPLAVAPVATHSAVPGAPVISGLRPALAAGGRIGIVVTATPGENTTDGYGVYVNGHLAAWSFAPTVFMPVYGGSQYTVEVTGLNSAGQSPRSAPRTVLVPQG